MHVLSPDESAAHRVALTPDCKQPEIHFFNATAAISRALRRSCISMGDMSVGVASLESALPACRATHQTVFKHRRKIPPPPWPVQGRLLVPCWHGLDTCFFSQLLAYSMWTPTGSSCQCHLCRHPWLASTFPCTPGHLRAETSTRRPTPPSGMTLLLP